MRKPLCEIVNCFGAFHFKVNCPECDDSENLYYTNLVLSDIKFEMNNSLIFVCKKCNEIYRINRNEYENIIKEYESKNEKILRFV